MFLALYSLLVHCVAKYGFGVMVCDRQTDSRQAFCSLIRLLKSSLKLINAIVRNKNLLQRRTKRLKSFHHLMLPEQFSIVSYFETIKVKFNSSIAEEETLPAYELVCPF